MGTTTSGDLALYKPADAETGWGSSVNTNVDTIDTEVTKIRKMIFKAEAAFADADTTPDVSSTGMFRTANTGATSITTFDSGTTGQLIRVRINDNNTTIVHGSGIVLPGAINRKATTADIYMFHYDGTNWYLIHGYGSAGTGQTVYLASPDTIGDWIGVSVTSATDVDVSDDSVPKGAKQAIILVHMNSSGVTPVLRCRINGSSDTGNNTIRYNYGNNSGYGMFAVIEVDLDVNGIFEAWWSAAWTLGTNAAYVLGYRR